MMANQKIINVDSEIITELVRKEIIGHFVDESIEGVFVTTLEGEYLYCNPALWNIYGYDSFTDLKQGLKNDAENVYLVPDRRRQFLEVMNLHGKVENFVSQVRCKDGGAVWITENSKLYQASDGKSIIGVPCAISRLKKSLTIKLKS
jgi:PAS domain S-box-containing protein